MKKVLAVLISVVILFSIGITAFAEFPVAQDGQMYISGEQMKVNPNQTFDFPFYIDSAYGSLAAENGITDGTVTLVVYVSYTSDVYLNLNEIKASSALAAVGGSISVDDWGPCDKMVTITAPYEVLEWKKTELFILDMTAAEDLPTEERGLDDTLADKIMSYDMETSNVTSADGEKSMTLSFYESGVYVGGWPPGYTPPLTLWEKIVEWLKNLALTILNLLSVGINYLISLLA